MDRLSVRLLGALQVTLGGTPITGFESDKERALLAFLAEESEQPHRREKLVGLLWPELTESAGRKNLRRAVTTCAGSCRICDARSEIASRLAPPASDEASNGPTQPRG